MFTRRDIIKLLTGGAGLVTLGATVGVERAKAQSEESARALRAEPLATPGYLYISLHTAEPDEDTANNEAPFPMRAAIKRSHECWSVDSEKVTNVQHVTFPSATEPCSISYFGVSLKERGGPLLWIGPLARAMQLEAGDCATFAPGDIEIESDDFGFPDELL